MSQNVSSAEVVIGALRVKQINYCKWAFKTCPNIIHAKQLMQINLELSVPKFIKIQNQYFPTIKILGGARI